MKKMKMKLALTLALVASTAMTGTANAATRTFIISNGTFTDGGTFGGSFDYNDIGFHYSNVNIFSKGGGFTDFSYNDRDIDYGGGDYLVLDAGMGVRFFNINFPKKLSDVMESISFRARSGYEINAFYDDREINTATLTVAAVPENSTWLMMLAGFGLIGAATRYRRKSVKVRYA